MSFPANRNTSRIPILPDQGNRSAYDLLDFRPKDDTLP